MALIHSFTAADGTVYPEAYTRVVTVRCDKTLGYVFVSTYANEDARLADDIPLWSEERHSLLAVFNGDILANAYAFIKTCPGYEGAVDHLPDPEPIVQIIEPIQAVTHPAPTSPMVMDAEVVSADSTELNTMN